MSYCAGCDSRHPDGDPCPPSRDDAIEDLEQVMEYAHKLQEQLDKYKMALESVNGPCLFGHEDNNTCSPPCDKCVVSKVLEEE